MDLLDWRETYPNKPGHRGVDTSVEAADGVTGKQARLQQAVLDYIRTHGPSTTNEIANGTRIDYDSIQPRTSELRKKNMIRDTGERRKNEKNKNVIVWGLV